MINPSRWEYLVPDALHKRRRELEALLRTWVHTPDGALWLEVALREQGVFRAKAGDMLPVAEFSACGTLPMMMRNRDAAKEPRFGPETEDLGSGRPHGAGGFAVAPTVRLEVVDDPVLPGASIPESLPPSDLDAAVPRLITTVPAHVLVSQGDWSRRPFVLYQFIFGERGTCPEDGFFHIGISTRSCQTWWSAQHRAMEAGSLLPLHRTLRTELSAGRVAYMHHRVIAVSDDVRALYAMEEAIVAANWNDPRRLNAMPGGQPGLAYLREAGIISDRIAPLPDERERLLSEWMARQEAASRSRKSSERRKAPQPGSPRVQRRGGAG